MGATDSKEEPMRDFAWIKTSYIAHRGYHSADFAVPENTMKAFDLAIQKGFAIEFDVNLMKDGTLVVFHDGNLERMTGKPGKLIDLDYTDVRKLRIHDTQETIPTLKQVLDFVAGRVPLLIELKNHGENDKMCQNFMAIMDQYHGIWAVQSFHPFTVGWFKKHRPDVIRGQIAEYFLQDEDLKPSTKWLLKRMAFNLLNKPDFINYGLKYLPNAYVDRVKRRKICVIAYCARTRKELDYCRTYIDNAVFEFFDPTLTD
jgi:glycerophosphoryl diester phosphodiesterase